VLNALELSLIASSVALVVNAASYNDLARNIFISATFIRIAAV
jgi:hypothetical protein